MRLIDADELINQGYEIVVEGWQYDTCNKSIDIDNIPTAYSVDKVVTELNELDVKAIKRYKGGTFGDYEGTDYYIEKSRTIEIVKRGWKGAVMERLTDSNKEIPTLVDNAEYWLKVYFKLKEYEDLEEQGRLVKLPCKIGTEVYDITWWDNVQEKVVVKGKTYYRTIHKHKVSKSTFGYTDIEEIGKTVFLTKSEAEAKLKELRGGENDG